MNRNLTSLIDSLKKSKSSFKVHLSKNSQIVFTNNDAGEVKKIPFSKKKLNPKIFHVSKKIKEESSIFLHYNKEFFDKQDRGAIRYYNYNPLPKSLKRFYFIDISACYITILKNKKVISESMYNQINSLPKGERLISLGMLAYEPYEVIYEKGIRTSVKRIPNEYSPIFYYACALTQELMEKIINKIDNRYLFYWVDGIFFKNQSDYNLAKDILKTLGFKFRFGSCYNLKTKDKGNYYKVTFQQNDKGELTKKEYSIPVYFEDYKEKKESYNFIINEDFDSLLANYSTKKGLIK